MLNKETVDKKKENPFVNLIFCLIIPTAILSKMSTADRLGPVNALLIALSFPIFYSLYDYYKRREVSFISGLGFVSILLTGTFALYELPAHWIAIKEASIPLLIGLTILLSMRTTKPLVKRLIYNDTIMNVDLVAERLSTPQQKIGFEKLLTHSSYLLAGSFVLSAILNYGLAKYMLISPPGTAEFNAELGEMNLYSYPIILVPSVGIMMFALIRLMKGIQRLTGLEMEDVLKTQSRK